VVKGSVVSSAYTVNQQESFLLSLNSNSSILIFLATISQFKVFRNRDCPPLSGLGEDPNPQTP
jgi:hypothetical protein